MQPNQPQQPHTPPQQLYHSPEYEINPNVLPPTSPAMPSMPVQHSDGHYEVVPPLTPSGVAHSGHNPYEFIMNPNMAKKKSLFGGSALLPRIALLVGSLVVLMIIAVVVISALGPKSSVPGLTAIAERQQEIVRIAASANGQTAGQDTTNLVASINASITSSQQSVITYLAAHGTKLNAKILALDKNPQTDTLLSNAANANNYDNVVAQTLAQQLSTYEGLLQTTFKQASSKLTKQLLQGCYISASKLLAQAKALSAGNNP